MKLCTNLLEWRKTLLELIEWCYSILLLCDKYAYNITNWSDLRIAMKISQMHKIPKSIATSRLHCAYKCEKVRQLTAQDA